MFCEGKTNDVDAVMGYRGKFESKTFEQANVPYEYVSRMKAAQIDWEKDRKLLGTEGEEVDNMIISTFASKHPEAGIELFEVCRI